jgi:hypothetical protein
MNTCGDELRYFGSDEAEALWLMAGEPWQPVPVPVSLPLPPNEMNEMSKLSGTSTNSRYFTSQTSIMIYTYKFTKHSCLSIYLSRGPIFSNETLMFAEV